MSRVDVIWSKCSYILYRYMSFNCELAHLCASLPHEIHQCLFSEKPLILWEEFISAGVCLGSTQYFLFHRGFVNVVQFNYLPQDYFHYTLNFVIWGKSEAFHNTYLDASQKGVHRDQPQEVRTLFKEIANKCIDKEQKDCSPAGCIECLPQALF